MVTRIPHIQEWGPKIDQFLLGIRPNWPSKGWNALTPIGQFLRNPSLDNIEAPGWMEILIFNPKVTGSPSIVLAFPVSEPSAYIRHLASQPAITNQTVGAGISHLRESHGSSTDLYLSPVATRIMLFSTNRKTVELAVELYRKEENGLLPDAQGDMEFHLNPKRVLKAHSIEIDQDLRQLRDDIGNDLVESAAQLSAPVKRVLHSGLSELKGLAGQIVQVRGVLSLEEDHLLLKTTTSYTEDELAGYFRQEPRLRPALLKQLPARSLTHSWSAVSIGNVRSLAAGLARTAATGLDGAVNSNARQSCSDFLEAFLAMGPTETVAATLAPSKEVSRHQGQVRLLSVRHPQGLKVCIQRLKTMLAPGSGLVDSFERSGIAVIVTHQPRAWTDPASGVSVQSLTLIARATGKGASGGMTQDILQFRHTLYMATLKNTLILITSDSPRHDMGQVLKSVSQATAYAKSAKGANILAHLGRETYSSVWAMTPLAYIKAASSSTMLDGREHFVSGRPHPSVDYSRQFHSVPEPEWPIIITTRSEFVGELKRPITQNTFLFKFQTLRALGQALLDSTLTAHQSGRKP
ncbi:MAG: hypothetical protein ACYTGH_01060 [Planctomycetota bacterium]|jgi:hypothetical protein